VTLVFKGPVRALRRAFPKVEMWSHFARSARLGPAIPPPPLPVLGQDTIGQMPDEAPFTYCCKDLKGSCCPLGFFSRTEFYCETRGFRASVDRLRLPFSSFVFCREFFMFTSLPQNEKFSDGLLPLSPLFRRCRTVTSSRLAPQLYLQHFKNESTFTPIAPTVAMSPRSSQPAPRQVILARHVLVIFLPRLELQTAPARPSFRFTRSATQ